MELLFMTAGAHKHQLSPNKYNASNFILTDTPSTTEIKKSELINDS